MALKDYAGAIVNGAALASNLLGLGQKKQDKRQIEQARKLNEINKENANLEHELKMKMWKDTNYSAQLDEANKAGISKAAAIGGGGPSVGSASVASAPASAADAAATSNANTNNMMAQAQLGLMAAQTKNIEADTANKNAGTENIGIDTNKKGIEIKSITQGIENQKENERLTRLQANLQESTNSDNAERIMWEAKKVMTEYEKTVYDTFVAKETQEQAISLIKSMAAEGLLNVELKKAGITKTKEEIKQIATNIALGKSQIEFQGTDKVLGKYIEKVAKEIENINK